MQTTFILPL